MKIHSNDFKNKIKEMGRELDSIITYTDENEGQIILNEELYSISINYEGAILKSVMKELTIESSVDIPKDTIVNYRLGVLVDEEYEYLNYGNFVVKESEKQEDADTYIIKCYDKILYAMKEYEEIDIEYPTTVRGYIKGLCDTLGVQFANNNDTFANYNRPIYTDLYKDIGYTYRDVLDELAEVTASTICINNNDQLEIRYIENTVADNFDGEFLKDVNVRFGEKYGPINSIVLSRAAETDNVYLQDVDSIEANGLCELKIVDNQIMNNNDRSDYLEDILTKLDGLQYYIADFSSTGILYLDLCDRYTIAIDGTTYQCIMFNDEINVEQGLEENIYAKMPEESETDYTKADKTDQRINQTYLIVDKQNQTIQSVVTNVTEQNNKIAQITQTVDEINSKISDIADITTSGESSYATVSLERINESEPIVVKIHPVVEEIGYLYGKAFDYRNPDPTDEFFLYPSDTLYPKGRLIRFTRTYEEEGETLTEDIDYELPEDLLWYSNNVYDEFYLSYNEEVCRVIKRCGRYGDGAVYPLGTEEIHDYPYPQLLLGDGDYQISILGYTTGYLFVQLLAQNIYTDQFAIKAEVRTEINQTATDILLEAAATYETKENANTNYASLRVSINGIESVVSSDELISRINQTSDAVTINANKISLQGKTIELTSDNIKIQSTKFNVTADGTVTCVNMNATNMNAVNATMTGATITGGNISLFGGTESAPKFYVAASTTNPLANSNVTITDSKVIVRTPNTEITGGTEPEVKVMDILGTTSAYMKIESSGDARLQVGKLLNVFVVDTGNSRCTYTFGRFSALSFDTVSLEKYKKNINLYEESAIDIVKNSDIYTFNYKTEEDTDKKHIGFVIGDKYKTPKEVIGKDKEGIDTYATSAILWKAMQEIIKKMEDK